MPTSRATTLRTQRWCDPRAPDDGLRVLVCRFRPRGLPRSKETWDVWMKELGPSPALLAAFHGKGDGPITLEVYVERYIAEMEGQRERIRALATRLDQGEIVTLLCSRDCILPQACHRTVLAALIEAQRAR